jgi:co-chaperonin GroES (HSP10)
MKIKPFGNQILIEPINKKQIIGVPTLCEYGTVVAIGDDVQVIKVGEVVGFIKWGINELDIDGKKYLFVQENAANILGTIELSLDVAA